MTTPRRRSFAAALLGIALAVGAAAPAAAAEDTEAPTAPTITRLAPASGGDITVAWSAATDNVGVVGYDVYRGTVLLGTSQTTTFLHRGAGPGRHTYVVAARDAAGNTTRSAPQWIIIEDTTPQPPSPRVVAVTDTTVELRWLRTGSQFISNRSYRVFRDGVQVGEVAEPNTAPSERSFTDTGLTPSTRYSYEVRAVNSIGQVSASVGPRVATTLPAARPGAPSTPGNVRAGAVTTASITVTWNPSTDDTGVTGYRVYRDATAVGTVTGTSFVDTGLQPATGYVYTVTALDADGNASAAATPATLTTAANLPPTAPTGLTATAVRRTSVTLSWTAATDDTAVARYEVFRDGRYLAQVNGSTLTWTDTALTGNTAYTYTVRAQDDRYASSPHSAPVTVTTPADPGALRVRYRNGEGAWAVSDNQIRPHLRVVNPGPAALSLSTVTLRYHFTRDGATTVNAFCDWAVVGCANVRLRVVNAPSSVGDTYLEVSFSAGTVAAGRDSGDIQLRLARSDWRNFAEADDHSRGAETEWTDAPRIPGYVDGAPVWGTPPA